MNLFTLKLPLYKQTPLLPWLRATPFHDDVATLKPQTFLCKGIPKYTIELCVNKYQRTKSKNLIPIYLNIVRPSFLTIHCASSIVI